MDSNEHLPQANQSRRSPLWTRLLRGLGRAFIWIVLALLTLWSAAAIYFDCRIPALNLPLTIVYIAAVIATYLALVFKFKHTPWAKIVFLLGFCCVLGWWLTLKPSNVGDWKSDADHTAWAEINGDQITIHNLRNCDYKTETVYTNCWGDRNYKLSDIRGADFFLINWGIPYASHVIMSFQFGDNEHVAFSIEARYKNGQDYSSFKGCFRQYELIIIAADERDLIRLRTNFRKDEEVYIYRLMASCEVARGMFMAYVNYLNQLKDHPEWYNAVTRNCTTTMDKQLMDVAHSHHPWNYKILLNGSLDELLYDRGNFVTGDLSFPQLKQREHINPAAHAINDSADYSRLIRVGRVGY